MSENFQDSEATVAVASGVEETAVSIFKNEWHSRNGRFRSCTSKDMIVDKSHRVHLPWIPELLCPSKRMFCVNSGCHCQPIIIRYLCRDGEDVDQKFIFTYVKYQCQESKNYFNTLNDRLLARLPICVNLARSQVYLTGKSIMTGNLLSLVQDCILSPKGVNQITEKLIERRTKKYCELLLASESSSSTVNDLGTLDSFLLENKPLDPRVLQEMWLEATEHAALFASALMWMCEVKKAIFIDGSQKFSKHLFVYDPVSKKRYQIPGTRLLLLAVNEIHQIKGRRFAGSETKKEVSNLLFSVVEDVENPFMIRNSSDFLSTEEQNSVKVSSINVTTEPTVKECVQEYDETCTASNESGSQAEESASEAEESVREDQSDDDAEIHSEYNPEGETVSVEHDETSNDMEIIGLEETLVQSKFDAAVLKKEEILMSDSVNFYVNIAKEISNLPTRKKAYKFGQDPWHLSQRHVKKIKKEKKKLRRTLRSNLHKALYLENGELRDRFEMFEKVKTTLAEIKTSDVSSNYKNDWPGTCRNTLRQIERGDLEVKNNRHVENGCEVKLLTTSPLEGIHSLMKNLAMRQLSYPVAMRVMDFFIIKTNLRQGNKFGRNPKVNYLCLIELCRLAKFMPSALSQMELSFALNLIEAIRRTKLYEWRDYTQDKNHLVDCNIGFILEDQRMNTAMSSEEKLHLTVFEKFFLRRDLNSKDYEVRCSQDVFERLCVSNDPKPVMNDAEIMVLSRILFDLAGYKTDWAASLIVVSLLYNNVAGILNHSRLLGEDFPSNLVEPKSFFVISENLRVAKARLGDSKQDTHFLNLRKPQTPPQKWAQTFSPKETLLIETLHSFLQTVNPKNKKKEFVHIWEVCSRASSEIYSRSTVELYRKYDSCTRAAHRKSKPCPTKNTQPHSPEFQLENGSIDRSQTTPRGKDNELIEPMHTEEQVQVVDPESKRISLTVTELDELWSPSNLARLEQKHRELENKYGRYKILISWASTELAPEFKSVSIKTFKRRLKRRLDGFTKAQHANVEGPDRSESSKRVPTAEAAVGKTVVKNTGSRVAACDSCKVKRVKCDGTDGNCKKRRENNLSMISFMKKAKS